MKEIIQWQAFEYEHQNKTADWFWFIWIIAIGIVITAYLFNNLLFGFLILVSAFSLSLYASRKPDLLQFKINEEGLSVKNKTFLFSNLKSFWIEDNQKIILQAQTKTAPLIIIPLSKTVDINKLKEYLLLHLEEVEYHEPLTQKIFEKLGF